MSGNIENLFDDMDGFMSFHNNQQQQQGYNEDEDNEEV